MPMPNHGHARAPRRHPPEATAFAAALLLAFGMPTAVNAEDTTPSADLEEVLALHLERGLAYMEQGEYARAVLEFEQVFQLDYVSPDVRERAEAYAEAARLARQGERVSYSGFAQTGLGYYRENSTESTSAGGGGPARDPFVLARLNGGMTYLPGNEWSLDGNLDYRFRYYDADGRRNDSDLRWAGTGRRALEDGSVSLGARGRLSYRGNATYRNDFGVFINRDYLVDADSSILVEADLRRRQYQSSLSDRNRTNFDAGVTWTRAVQDGRGSVSLNGRIGYEWRRSSSPDGDATIYGLTAEWSGELTESTSAFAFGWYEHNGFHSDRVVFDEQDAPVGARTRADDLFEFGGGLVYRFADGWTLRPEILYIRDESNTLWGNYSSTEVWVAVRRAL